MTTQELSIELPIFEETENHSEFVSPRGCIVPMITPVIFDTHYKGIDWKGVETVVDHIKKGKADGIFILGNAGSFQCLPVEDKVNLITDVTLLANDIPVYVGISDSSLENTKKLAHHAELCHASAVVLIPHFDGTDPDIVVDSVMKATSLPVVFYNNPGICAIKSDLSDSQVRKWNTLYPNRIAGVKESSGNRDVFLSFALMQKEIGIPVLMGDAKSINWARSLESQIDGYTLRGAIPVHANLETEKYSQYFQNVGAIDADLDAYVAEFPSIPHTIRAMNEAGFIGGDSFAYWQESHT